MIPKLLHFIWIGKDIPKWAKFSIDTFKKGNPTFDIKLWHYNSIIDNENNNYLKQYSLFFIDQLNKFLDHHNYNYDLQNYNDILLPKIQFIWQSQIKLILSKPQNKFLLNTRYDVNNFPEKLYSALGDVLKFIILYYHGGIYLDCDTFPMKPFDDILLQTTFQSYKDIFFLGSLKNENFYFIRDDKLRTKNITSIPVEKNINRELQEQFYSCTLNYKLYDHNKSYIYHFKRRSWW